DKAIFESTYLTLFPEVLDQSPFMDTRRYRLATGQPAAGGLPDWWPGNSNPLVYATFGTVAPVMPQMVALCRAVLNAVAGLPVRVLMTVGREFDFAQLGVPPGNVRIERWVDQDEVLAHAALVICHGGAGTTLGALSAGVPVVAFPLFADQAANAACVAVAGAGIMISAGGVAAAHRKIERDDSALIRTAVLAVLDSAEYVRASTGIRAAFHNLPTLAETYDVILEEQFSASR
ncbi:MAG: nucleotide disphospho-sugar-binding domain-containing protein, partial [Nakamurella sp.]